MAAKKTETVKARFQEAIDTYKKLRDFDYVTPLQAFLDEPISESDRNRVQKSFVKGLSERFGPEADFSLKLAFEAADLDSQDPLAREALLRLFAMAHFPSGQKNRGRRKQWDDQRLCCLLSDYDQTKQDHPSSSDQAICEYIKKRFANRYRMTISSIRRKLQDARNPACNNQIDELAAIFGREFRHHGVDWSSAKIRKQTRRCAIEYLSKAWKRGERK
jgi:hypothetical protein